MDDDYVTTLDFQSQKVYNNIVFCASERLKRGENTRLRLRDFREFHSNILDIRFSPTIKKSTE